MFIDDEKLKSVIPNNSSEDFKSNTENVCETSKTDDEDSEFSDLNKFQMGRYVYDTDEKNKKDKLVRKRTILLYSKRLFLIFLAAVIFNFGVIAFLNRGDTIPSGLSGFPMLAVLIAKNYGYVTIDKYFALMFLAVNIPLFLTYGLKEKRSFVLLTLYFMLAQIITNMIFTMIPGVQE
ncbi:UNVERIFIED_CONTAM: hypothetical protein O8I53_09475 [Campylobacter lari]